MPILLLQDRPTLRPREKVAKHGVESLSLEELLRSILGSGVRHMRIDRLSRLIATKILEKKPLTFHELQRIRGIGPARACQILAAIELVERLRPQGKPVVDSLPTALQHLEELKVLEREVIVCLYLNARLQLVTKETLAMGSLNQVSIRPSDVFAPIKLNPIQHILLAHNHPSGNAAPSTTDIEFTTQIRDACEIMGIEMIDHIILAKNSHYSLKAHNWQ